MLATILRAPGTAGAASVPTGFVDLRPLTTSPRPGLDLPVGMAFLPDGRRLLVIEQKTARLRLFVDNSLSIIDPVATLPGVNTAGGEQGLLGIAVDPGWPARPYLYIQCDDSAGHIRISRYTARGELVLVQDGHLTVDPATRYDVIDDAPDTAPNHNGGTLRFGPDGMLYASLGDDMDHCAAQDSSVLAGKILRLDVSRLPAGAGGPAPRALIAPPGNPFAAAADSNARLVWAEGLRNPFRFAIDPVDGALYIGDAGEATWEEIDRAAAGGRDFGWPLREGPAAFDFPCPNALAAGDPPIYAYPHAGLAAAVIGGAAYRRPAHAARGFPADYEGDVFFGDYYLGFLRRLHGEGGAWSLAAPVEGQPSSTDWGRGFANVSEWQVGPDGGLWYCLQAVNFPSTIGDVREIVARADTTVPPPAEPAVRFERPAPTPARGSTVLTYAHDAPARVSLRLYDLEGRLVRTLVAPAFEDAGSHPVPWDGRDDDGRELRAGFYVARLEVDATILTQRVPLLR